MQNLLDEHRRRLAEAESEAEALGAKWRAVALAVDVDGADPAALAAVERAQEGAALRIYRARAAIAELKRRATEARP